MFGRSWAFSPLRGLGPLVGLVLSKFLDGVLTYVSVIGVDYKVIGIGHVVDYVPLGHVGAMLIIFML